VIDDDPAVLDSIGDFMEDRGHSVTRAPDLRCGYELLEKTVPDVVIIDYELPDGDALQFLTILRKCKHLLSVSSSPGMAPSIWRCERLKKAQNNF